MKTPLLACLVVLCACGSSPSSNSALAEAKSSVVRDLAPTVSSADTSALIAANESFSFDMYGQLKAKAGNVFFSPLSLAEALTMLNAGANGQTKTEIEAMLHANTLSGDSALFSAWDSLDLTLASYNQVPDAAGADGKPFQLAVANGLFGQHDLTFEQPFLDTLAGNFGAGVYLVDFINNPAGAETEINQWGSYHTDGAIPQVLPPGTINSTDRLVLANAVYFSAGWQQVFSANDTSPATFTRLDGSTVSVPLMNQLASFPYAAGAGYQAISLPYSVAINGKNDLSMIVVMPSAGTFSTFESTFTATQFETIRASLAPTQVMLSLPKVKLDTGSMDLSANLEALGMVTAFSGAADFSGITTKIPLQVASVIQEATLDVAESGTVAAAVTVVVIETGAVAEPPTYVTMTINQPYLVFLYDAQTQTILFQGRIVDPSSAQ